MTKNDNPFKIGDRVTFAPGEHTIGWMYLSFFDMRLFPGDTGTITRLKENFVYIDDKGGISWQTFVPANEDVSRRERTYWEAMVEKARSQGKVIPEIRK